MNNRLGKFLCSIGLHNWVDISNGFCPDRFRSCKRCDRKQIFDDFTLEHYDITDTTFDNNKRS